MTDRVLAVDVGGTKLAAAIVDATGNVHGRAEVPTPATDDPESVWIALEALLAGVDDGAAAVAVGCGGPMTWPEGVVMPLNIPAWRAGFPLRARLRERVNARVVRVHNDAVAMTVGEHWVGAARGARSALGMVVSTGVGGGLVVDDRLLLGATGNAGHVGHVVVDADGPSCGCGGRGCLEAVARGPAVLDWARQQGWSGAADATGRELVADARAGDAVALLALTRAGRAVGLALASVAHLLDLEVAVIGGGMANAGELLLEPARAAYERYARLPYARSLRIVPAALGGDSGLVGAAAFVHQAARYWPGAAD